MSSSRSDDVTKSVRLCVVIFVCWEYSKPHVCLKGVLRVLQIQGCSKKSPSVFQGCSNDVAWMFVGCLKIFSKGILRYFKVVPMVFSKILRSFLAVMSSSRSDNVTQFVCVFVPFFPFNVFGVFFTFGCFKEVSRLFQKSFKGVSRKFRGCFKDV